MKEGGRISDFYHPEEQPEIEVPKAEKGISPYKSQYAQDKGRIKSMSSMKKEREKKQKSGSKGGSNLNSAEKQ